MAEIHDPQPVEQEPQPGGQPVEHELVTSSSEDFDDADASQVSAELAHWLLMNAGIGE